VVKRPDRLFGAYAFDCDGTVYVDDVLLPTALDAISALKSYARVAYVTNSPLRTPSQYAQKLTRLGLPTEPDNVISSIDAMVAYLNATAEGARLFVVGEEVLVGALIDAGYRVVDVPAEVDVVVVGFDRRFDYAKLLFAYRAVRGGARIVATNPDPYCPTQDGGLPDCAAMLAAIEVATGMTAEAVVGKPSPHMARLILDRLAVVPADLLFVGDRLETDVRLAAEAGMRSALVLTGATRLADVAAAPDRPDYVIESLADLIPPTLPDSSETVE
jgi:HAD superfamily hydrolase (TIGR01450 family)